MQGLLRDFDGFGIYEKDEFDEDMVIAILGGMNRLEDWTRLVGRGTIWRFLLSHEDDPTIYTHNCAGKIRSQASG